MELKLDKTLVIIAILIVVIGIGVFAVPKFTSKATVTYPALSDEGKYAKVTLQCPEKLDPSSLNKFYLKITPTSSVPVSVRGYIIPSYFRITCDELRSSSPYFTCDEMSTGVTFTIRNINQPTTLTLIFEGSKLKDIGVVKSIQPFKEIRTTAYPSASYILSSGSIVTASFYDILTVRPSAIDLTKWAGLKEGVTIPLIVFLLAFMFVVIVFYRRIEEFGLLSKFRRKGGEQGQARGGLILLFAILIVVIIATLMATGVIKIPFKFWKGSISGSVITADTYVVNNTTKSVPLPNVTISLPGTEVTAKTDANGKYTISDLTAGDYDIIAVFENASGDVYNISSTVKVERGETAIKNFQFNISCLYNFTVNCSELTGEDYNKSCCAVLNKTSGLVTEYWSNCFVEGASPYRVDCGV